MTDFVTIKDFLDKSEIRDIFSLVSNVSNGRGLAEEDQKERQSLVQWMPMLEQTAWLYDKVGEGMSAMNIEYFQRSEVSKIESLQVAKYGPNGDFYGKHTDKGKGHEHRILSITVQLSDPSDYEGGELRFQDEIDGEKEIGSAIVFRSDLWHEVMPVTRGTRYSLVTWAHGVESFGVPHNWS